MENAVNVSRFNVLVNSYGCNLLLAVSLWCLSENQKLLAASVQKIYICCYIFTLIMLQGIVKVSEASWIKSFHVTKKFEQIC